MKTTPKGILVKKTEIYFNKEELLELLSSATDSNVVVVSTKHYNANDDINISFQAQPMVLNTTTGTVTPEKGGNVLIGSSSWPCPYPPGCLSIQAAEKAKLMASHLKLKEKRGR